MDYIYRESGFSLPLDALGNPARRLLGNHERRAVGIAAGDAGHDASIDHAQTGNDATLAISETQMRINHGCRIISAPHLGCAHGMEDRGGNITSELCQISIALVLTLGLYSSGLCFASAGLWDSSCTR